MNNVMNILVLIFWGPRCLCFCGVELLDYRISVCSILIDTSSFPKGLYALHFPSTESLLSPSPSTTVIVSHFHFSHPGKWGVVLHYGFNLHFPDDSEIELFYLFIGRL